MHKKHKVKIAQVSIHWQMDKQIVVYPYQRITLSKKKKKKKNKLT